MSHGKFSKAFNIAMSVIMVVGLMPTQSIAETQVAEQAAAAQTQAATTDTSSVTSSADGASNDSATASSTRFCWIRGRLGESTRGCVARRGRRGTRRGAHAPPSVQHASAGARIADEPTGLLIQRPPALRSGQ